MFLVLAYCYLKCVHNWLDKNLDIINFLENIEYHNEFTDKDMHICLNKNRYNQYIHLFYNAENSSKKKHLTYICCILREYCSVLNFAPISIYKINYKPERFDQKKLILLHFIQTYCMLHQTIKNKSIKYAETISYKSLVLQKNAIKSIDDVDSVMNDYQSNFYVISNCLKSKNDFMLFYRIASDLNKPQEFDKNVINIFFVLEFNNNKQVEIWKNLQIKRRLADIGSINRYENFLYDCVCIDDKNLSQYNFLTKCKIEKTYRCYKPNVQPSIIEDKGPFKLLKNYLISLFDKILSCFTFLQNKQSKIFHRETTNNIEKISLRVDTILDSYPFVFFICRKNYMQKEKNKHEKYIYVLISIYYKTKGKMKLYDRYACIEKEVSKNIFMFKKNNEPAIIRYENISVFETFLKKFFFLLSINIMQLSNFLPGKCFLDIIGYPFWYNYDTKICCFEQGEKKINFYILMKLIRLIKYKYEKYFEISYLLGSIKNSKQLVYAYHHGNMFNVCQIESIIQKKNITKKLLQFVKIFIIAIKSIDIQKGTNFIIIPIIDHQPLLVIYNLNYIWNVFCEIHTYDRMNQFRKKQFLVVRCVIYDCIFKHLQIDCISYDIKKLLGFILCKKRTLLFVILYNARSNYFLTKSINYIPKELDWLNNSDSYDCIMQSTTFTSIINKHKNHSSFNTYVTLCFNYLNIFCQFYEMEQNNYLWSDNNLFWFFQPNGEINTKKSDISLYEDVRKIILNA
ncbi:hypothetical protein COBT_002207 [Conglomerata obtusa]